MTRVLLLIIISSICFLPNVGSSQEKTGIKDSIYSNVLQENRQFHEIRPEDYNLDGNDTLYEVLYILDGQYYIRDVPFVYNWTVRSG